MVFLILRDQTASIEIDREVTIQKRHNATISGDLHHLNVNETYKGSDNPITMTSLFQGDFICTFSGISRYPFDTQECSVELYIPGTANNLTRLVPTSISNEGPSSVGQYDVMGWHIHTDKLRGGKNGLRVSVGLRRNLASIFLVTYLPTILMNLINQATNYLGQDSYELLITVNITCMMVLASVYISVSSSLPLTAAIKNIEIWLLFNLAFPALVILINIIYQVKFSLLILQFAKFFILDCNKKEFPGDGKQKASNPSAT